MPASRDPTDFWLDPMNRIACPGTQNEARRVCNSATVGRLPSRRRSGAAQPIANRVRVDRDLGLGAGNSTMKTPGPVPVACRPTRSVLPRKPLARSRSRPLRRGAGVLKSSRSEPCLAAAYIVKRAPPTPFLVVRSPVKAGPSSLWGRRTYLSSEDLLDGNAE